MNIKKSIEVSLIRIDGGTQSRVSLDDAVVAEYSALMKEGVKFPEITVYFDGSDFWLADGFHRLHAARSAELPMIDADVHEGTKRDALLASLGANSSHGLPRTNADKRHAVEILLRDPEWSQWSDREIARRAVVHNTFVSKVRRELSVDKLQIDPSSAPRTVRRGDTTYQMQPRTPAAEPARVDTPTTDWAPRGAEPLPKSTALQFSCEAIGLLGRIPLNDRLRDEALNDVIRWIDANR